MPDCCFLGQVLEPLDTVTFSHCSHCPGLGARLPHFRGGRLSGSTELPWVLLPPPRPRVLTGVHAACSPRSGLFCHSPASARVLCLLPAPLSVSTLLTLFLNTFPLHCQPLTACRSTKLFCDSHLGLSSHSLNNRLTE